MAKRTIDDETIQVTLLCNTIFNIAVLGFASYGIFLKNASPLYGLAAIVLMYIYWEVHKSVLETIFNR